MKHIVQVTDTYLYHFTVTDHDDGTKTLKVESQWTGAKDPKGLQTRWQVTLSNEEWVEVSALLL